MTTITDDCFSELWPTYIFKRTLADHEQKNRELVEIVMAMDSERADLTASYKGVGFLMRQEPAVRWLRETVNDMLRNYLSLCGITYSVQGDIQAWPNVNRTGDYHAPHNHGWSYLSGTYYVQVPADERPDAGNAIPPGSITYSDPRQGAYGHSLAADPNAAARHTIHPSPGTLLLWPSSLMHYVHPNRAETPRISISFNIVLEWQNDYAG